MPASPEEESPAQDSSSEDLAQAAMLTAMMQQAQTQSTVSFNIGNLSIPRRAPLRLPTVENLPHRTVSPMPSLNSAYLQALRQINDARQRNLQQQLTRNTPHNKKLPSGIVRTSTADYPESLSTAPIEYQPPDSLNTQISFQNLLNPQTTAPLNTDIRWMNDGLAYAQKPVNPAEALWQLRAQTLATQQAEAQLATAQAQADRARVEQQAQQLRNWAKSRQRAKANPQPVPLTQSLPLLTQPFKGQTNQGRLAELIKQAFQDPSHPELDILTQANGQGRLPESRLNQVQLNLDAMFKAGQITQAEYQELAVAAKILTTRNWLRHDTVDNGDGTVRYRGVKLDKTVAPFVVYADVKRYWDKEVHLSAQELGKAAIALSKGAYDFFIGDDIKTLRNPNAGLLARIVAGGSLLLTFGGGIPEKVGIGYIEKLGGKFLIRVSGKSEGTLLKLAEKGLSPEQIRSYKHFAADRKLESEIAVYHLSDGSKVFEGVKESTKRPDTHTVWQKFIDLQGKTRIYGHRTEYKDGRLLHWHEDFPNKRFEILLKNTNGQPYIDHLKRILNSLQEGH